MKAIILVAGRCTRRRPYTLDRPKYLIGGRSLFVRQFSKEKDKIINLLKLRECRI